MQCKTSWYKNGTDRPHRCRCTDWSIMFANTCVSLCAREFAILIGLSVFAWLTVSEPTPRNPMLYDVLQWMDIPQKCPFLWENWIPVKSTVPLANTSPLTLAVLQGRYTDWQTYRRTNMLIAILRFPILGAEPNGKALRQILPTFVCRWGPNNTDGSVPLGDWSVATVKLQSYSLGGDAIIHDAWRRRVRSWARQVMGLQMKSVVDDWWSLAALAQRASQW